MLKKSVYLQSNSRCVPEKSNLRVRYKSGFIVW